MQKDANDTLIATLDNKIRKMAGEVFDHEECVKTLQPFFRDKTELFIDAMLEEAQLSDPSRIEQFGQDA